MPAQILTLIDKLDSAEIVRSQIAAILVVETAKQMELAALASEDPELWALRVFVGRMNPWSEFLLAPEQESLDATPIVNVSYDNATFPKGAGNVVEQQRATGVFHIDCYGYGISQDVPGGGHMPGDELAEDEALRALRLVRNILMAAPYTYLGLRGIVARRWTQAINVYKPADADRRPVQNVVGSRLALEVDFNEYSPQTQGAVLESVHVEVRKTGTGQVLLKALFPTE